MEFCGKDTQYVRVYRIEHETGNHGPYNRGLRDTACRKLAELLNNSHSCQTHPNLWDETYNNQRYENWKCDNPNKGIRNLSCGFESMRDLKVWFNGHLDSLRRCGYVVKVYRVKYEDYIPGRSWKQVFFVKGNPTKVMRMYEIGLEVEFSYSSQN